MRVLPWPTGWKPKRSSASRLKARKEWWWTPFKPGSLVYNRPHKIDSRTQIFEGLAEAEKSAVTFQGVALMVGQGSQMMGITIGDVAVEADFIEGLLTKILEKFEPTTPVTMSFKKADFEFPAMICRPLPTG